MDKVFFRIWTDMSMVDEVTLNHWIRVQIAFGPLRKLSSKVSVD